MCHDGRLDLRTNEGLLPRTLFPDTRAASPSIETQGSKNEQERLSAITSRPDRDTEQMPISDGSVRTRPTRSEDKRSSESGNTQRENDRPRQTGKSAGASAMEISVHDKNLPPKQYTRFWYCHLNCAYPGPWRSQVPRCIGCEHVRCDQCQEELAVGRDPFVSGSITSLESYR